MSKIQFLLIFICSFMFAASIVEANTIDSNRNKYETTSNLSCPEKLIGASTVSPQSAYLLKYKDKSLEELQEELLLERIRLIESEQDMIQQGYTPNYVAGLDTVKAGLQMAHLLRQRFNVQRYNNPEKVHIPELIQFVDPHIDFIEKSIHNQNSSDRDIRLSQLELLKSEAQFRQQTKQVTYLWLMHLAVQLAVLATPTEHRSFIKKGDLPSDLSELANNFPDVIVLPTINNLGISAINRTDGTRVYFMSLIDSPIDVHSHKKRLFPDLFLAHDTTHAWAKEIGDPILQAEEEENVNAARMATLFNISFMYNLGNLPRHQRESVNFVYFELTFEQAGFIKYAFGANDLRELKLLGLVKDATSINTYDEFSHLMPNHTNSDYESVRKFAEKSSVDFAEFVLEINTELNSLRITNSP